MHAIARTLVEIQTKFQHVEILQTAAYGKTLALDEGSACMLFTREFYMLVRDRLTPGGAMSMQAGMIKLGELSFFTSIHRTLRDVFPLVAGYQSFVSCFGTPWGFIVASKKIDPNSQAARAV